MKNYITLGCIIISTIANAQQDPQFTNFDDNKTYFNPASMIHTKHICGNLIARNQWNSFGGNPNTIFFNVNGKISEHQFLGIQFLSDAIGQQNSNIGKISYAYQVILNKTQVAFGVNLNLFQSKWQSNFITPDTPQTLDDAIPNQNYSNAKFDMDFGFEIKNGPLYMGISSSHLNQADFGKNGNVGYQSVRHYFINSGYEIRKSWGSINPKFLAKSDIASTQVDFQIQTWLRYKYLIGLNYRISDAIAPVIGIKLPMNLLTLNLIYSYDFTTSKIKNYSNGSHEFTVSFCLAKPTYTERHTDPRHLGNYDFGPRGKW